MKKDNKNNLQKLVNDKKKQLMAIRLNQVVSGTQKPHEKKVLKKEIAKMLTANK